MSEGWTTRRALQLVALARARPLAVACLLAMVVALPSLWLPHVADDFFQYVMLDAYLGGSEGGARPYADSYGLPHVFHFLDTRAGSSTPALPSESLPWWSSPDLRIEFWRPISSLLAAVDVALAGRGAWFGHLHSVLWYLALVLVAAKVLALALGPELDERARRVWLLALLVFAVDDAHTMAVVWIAGRNAVVATVFALLALWAHLAWRRHGGAWRLGLEVLACGAALLAGEAGLAGLAYILAYELVAERERGPARLLAVLPAAMVVVVWLVHYQVSGFGAAGTGFYLEPMHHPGAWLTRLIPHASVLVAALVSPLPPDAYVLPIARPWIVAFALAISALVVAGLWWLWSGLDVDQRRRYGWLLLGSAGGLLPATVALPGSRLLIAPSLGVAVAIAATLQALWARAESKRGARLLARLGVAVHFVIPAVFWPIFTYAQAQVSERTVALVRDVPVEEFDRGVVVILPVAADPAFLFLGTLLRYDELASAPPFQILSPAPCDHRLSRPAARALTLEPVGCSNMLEGIYSALFRRLDRPFEVGQSVERQGLVVTVEAVDTDRLASRVRLDFDEAPDSEAYSWLVWDGQRLVPMDVPAVGESIELGWASGPSI